MHVTMCARVPVPFFYGCPCFTFKQCLWLKGRTCLYPLLLQNLMLLTFEMRVEDSVRISPFVGAACASSIDLSQSQEI